MTVLSLDNVSNLFHYVQKRYILYNASTLRVQLLHFEYYLVTRTQAKLTNDNVCGQVCQLSGATTL